MTAADGLEGQWIVKKTQSATKKSRQSTTKKRFFVEFTAANHVDEIMARRGELASKNVRQVKLSGVVSPSAVTLVLPRAAVRKLGLRSTGKSLVRYANGFVAERDTVMGVSVELLGRRDVFSAIVEPRRREALIGNILLGALDFRADYGLQRILPRNPRGPIYEL